MKRVNQTGSIGVFVVVSAILVGYILWLFFTELGRIICRKMDRQFLAIWQHQKVVIRIHKTTHLSNLQIKKRNSQSSGRGEARTDVKTEESKKTTPTPESSHSQQSPSSTTPAPSTPSKQSDKGLPKTGPEDVAISAVAFGILAFLTVAYQRSRYLIQL